MTSKIVFIKGDGIGPEVIDPALSVIEALHPGIELIEAYIGSEAVTRAGGPFPGETIDLIDEAGVCLLGAVLSSIDDPDPREDPGDMKAVPPAQRSPLLRLRRELDLYANIRPVRRPGSVQGSEVIDLVIVRENTEGLYSGIEREVQGGVVTERRITEEASRRICRTAFEVARSRISPAGAGVVCVHKANVLLSDRLFLDIFRQTAAEEADIASTSLYVDNAAMQLVLDPARFDVVLAPNMYGDILSDLAAGLIGGLGAVPSANVGADHALFEPVHGAAPDIAGNGIANPTAAMLSAAMLLDHIGIDGGDAIRRAVDEVYTNGNTTPDADGTASTASFTDQVLTALKGDN